VRQLRGKSKAELSHFLLTRGLWLVFLELTIIRFAWRFNVDYTQTIGQVIWAMGWSMVALAGLIYLPRMVLAAFSLGLIAFHNLFDNVDPAATP